ncbi:MAG: anion permease [Phenylobacterium sp.]|nr:anion permease [Phenylobacterium sp.]
MLLAILTPLGIAAAVYAFVLFRAALAGRIAPRPEAIALGAVTNFFDTLGIGSFAPTMAWFKLRRLVPDGLIPSTMLVGHTLPAVTQAVIFLVLLGVFVDPALLVGCALAVLLGALVGAPLVAKARVWIVQTVVGLALLVAAAFYALANLGLMPGGGVATSLPLPLMVLAIVANFVFGVLLNFGVGNYAPTLAMFSLMGMDPRLSFPIMAGGAALASVGASVRHIAIGKVDLRIATGLALGGIPAVLVAAFLVKSMPVELLRWLVIAVVVYAAIVILRAAAGQARDPQPGLL